MAAIFFLFFEEKKLPKNPDPSDERSIDGLEALGGTADAGIGRPVFGSTWVGLLALERSLTMAIAYMRCKNQGIAIIGFSGRPNPTRRLDSAILWGFKGRDQ